MNCVLLSKTTGLELDSYDMTSTPLPGPARENDYATAPMPVIALPVEQLDDEEALHTSFEEAISGRVSALQGRLSRLSAQQALSCKSGPQHGFPTTEPLCMDPANLLPRHRSLLGSLRQRYTIYLSLALAFSMLGFDLMGLLVLHMR